eukprot:symbB.v1.2.040048.t1/scaffold6956.1/size14269/1
MFARQIDAERVSLRNPKSGHDVIKHHLKAAQKAEAKELKIKKIQGKEKNIPKERKKSKSGKQDNEDEKEKDDKKDQKSGKKDKEDKKDNKKDNKKDQKSGKKDKEDKKDDKKDQKSGKKDKEDKKDDKKDQKSGKKEKEDEKDEKKDDKKDQKSGKKDDKKKDKKITFVPARAEKIAPIFGMPQNKKVKAEQKMMELTRDLQESSSDEGSDSEQQILSGELEKVSLNGTGNETCDDADESERDEDEQEEEDSEEDEEEDKEGNKEKGEEAQEDESSDDDDDDDDEEEEEEEKRGGGNRKFPVALSDYLQSNKVDLFNFWLDADKDWSKTELKEAWFFMRKGQEYKRKDRTKESIGLEAKTNVDKNLLAALTDEEKRQKIEALGESHTVKKLTELIGRG